MVNVWMPGSSSSRRRRCRRTRHRRPRHEECPRSEQLLRGGAVMTLHGYLMNSTRLPSGSRTRRSWPRCRARHGADRPFLDDRAGVVRAGVELVGRAVPPQTEVAARWRRGRSSEHEVVARPHLDTVEVHHLVAEVHHHDVLQLVDRRAQCGRTWPWRPRCATGARRGRSPRSSSPARSRRAQRSSSR